MCVPISFSSLLMTIDLHLAFGRVNGYKINLNQELIAIGITNTIGTVFSAHPATGSFSRSALKSKSGVRTPLAGIFTVVIVIVALYSLTPAFTWIPTAGVSAVIIHTLLDLVAKPPPVYSFCRVTAYSIFIFFHWAVPLCNLFFSMDSPCVDCLWIWNWHFDNQYPYGDRPGCSMSWRQQRHFHI